MVSRSDKVGPVFASFFRFYLVGQVLPANLGDMMMGIAHSRSLAFAAENSSPEEVKQ